MVEISTAYYVVLESVVICHGRTKIPDGVAFALVDVNLTQLEIPLPVVEGE